MTPFTIQQRETKSMSARIRAALELSRHRRLLRRAPTIYGIRVYYGDPADLA